jgi:elongation factor 1 alpha-like protein
MDENEDERARGVTVEVGVKHFETAHRLVTLLDAPGHRDFIPNMISGAAQADVALLVVPANEGEFESSFADNGQTKEHALLVRYLGVRRLVVAVNKMDMCGWRAERFEGVKRELLRFLTAGGYQEQDLLFVPCSGLSGDNLVEPAPGPEAAWSRAGPSLLAAIDSLPAGRRPLRKPLRLVVADVFKTIQLGACTVAGKIEAGVLREGQRVLVAPGSHPARVKAILRHRGNEASPAPWAVAGENVEVGLLDLEETMISAAGSVVCDPKHAMPVARRFVAEVNTFAALQAPLLNGTQVTLHTQGAQAPAVVHRLVSVLQGEGRPPRLRPRFVRKNETATVELLVTHGLCLERAQDYPSLSRVLLRQNGVTVAAGRVTDILDGAPAAT